MKKNWKLSEDKIQLNVQTDYSEYLNNGRAFKLVLTKENQIAGNYSAEMTWTLADAPTE